MARRDVTDRTLTLVSWSSRSPLPARSDKSCLLSDRPPLRREFGENTIDALGLGLVCGPWFREFRLGRFANQKLDKVHTTHIEPDSAASSWLTNRRMSPAAVSQARRLIVTRSLWPKTSTLCMGPPLRLCPNRGWSMTPLCMHLGTRSHLEQHKDEHRGTGDGGGSEGGIPKRNLMLTQCKASGVRPMVLKTPAGPPPRVRNST
jgi:hypothetical protein